MEYDYSKVFNFIIQKKIGKMYKWQPMSNSHGQFEALIYFCYPYWFAGNLENSEDFVTQLEEIGTQWKIKNPKEYIMDRISYYGHLFKPIWEANDMETLFKQEVMIKRIVYHLVYKHPLADLPINEADFEFMPPSFSEVCPELFVLVKSHISLMKIKTMPKKSDEINIVNAVGDICIAKQEIDKYGTPWVIIRYEDGNVYQVISNHTLDEMKKVWSQN